jgi:GMP synthase (glutamine-hydrolysing)
MNQKIREKILIVLHQATSSPGRMGQELIKRGYELDIRRPPLGDALPATLADHAGAIVFGGPMSANDGDEFIRREIDWMSVPLKEEKPFLGICLGAQKLVRHLGGRVTSHDEGKVEIGYYPIHANKTGEKLIPQWPNMIYQWHREGFDLPSGTTPLAHGDWFPNQAFQVGKRAFGIQFHVELTYAMMCKWTVKAEERLRLPGAQQRASHLEGRLLYDKQTRQWLDQFLDLWLGR